jgi:chromosomal replication initiator protein
MRAWETFLETVKQQLGDETTEKWLRPLKVIHFDACNLYLEAETNFQVEWFEEHIRTLARQKLLNGNFHPIKIHLTCKGQLPAKEKKEKEEKEAPIPFTLRKDPILDEYTKENFLFGKDNPILAKLLDEPEIQFNPLFLYGAPSTGKTHLLQVLTKEVLKKGLIPLYVKAETFTENVVRAIRSGNMQEFRKAHRHVDVLIIDDVQYLAGKAATQEEFFHTFNALHGIGKQVILSANVAPFFLENIEPRLVSRFEWGLSLPIAKLKDNELILMMQNRAKELDLPLGEKEIKFLISSFSSNPKSLQRSLEALCLRAEDKQQITIPIIKALLRDLLMREKRELLTPDKIVKYVSKFYDLQAKDILGKSQTQECALPRQMAMFLCRKRLNMPFSKIGDYFSRDHSTVMTSVKSLDKKTKSGDSEASSALAAINRKIEQDLL